MKQTVVRLYSSMHKKPSDVDTNFINHACSVEKIVAKKFSWAVKIE